MRFTQNPNVHSADEKTFKLSDLERTKLFKQKSTSLIRNYEIKFNDNNDEHNMMDQRASYKTHKTSKSLYHDYKSGLSSEGIVFGVL
jgi:hypothetical protein